MNLGSPDTTNRPNEPSARLRQAPRQLGLWETTIFGMLLLVMSVVLIYFVFELLRRDPLIGQCQDRVVTTNELPNEVAAPATQEPTDQDQTTTPAEQCELVLVTAFSAEFSISTNARLLLLAATVGALGSYIHIATSFITNVGRGTLFPRYIWWYALRPTIGASLALIFYFVLRGGFLSTGANADDVSLFGIAAISALVGMFSARGITKLEEIFSTLLGKEVVEGPEPAVTSIDPSNIQANRERPETLRVSGNNFVSASIVRLSGVDLATVYRSDTQLTATIEASLSTPGGTAPGQSHLKGIAP